MSDTLSQIAHPFNRKNSLAIATWFIVIVGFAIVANPYYASLGASIGLFAMLGLGMVLVTGYAGQFSLAVGAFYGIGAYSSTLLTAKFGWYGLLALFIGAAIAGMLGWFLARPLFRLRGHFLAMATLALTEVFFLSVNNAQSTGGSSGMGGIQPLNLFGLTLNTGPTQFVLNWLVVGIILWGMLMLRNGREGRALLAIRGNEAAAAAVGINIPSSKARVFAGSAIISAIAGSFYAHQILYISPQPFGLTVAIDVLMIAVLGGMRSPWGAIIGAIILEFLKQGIEAVLPHLLGSASVGAGQQMALGLLLVIILVTRPDGVAGLIADLARWVTKRHTKGEKLEAEHRTEASTTDMGELRKLQDSIGQATVGDKVLTAENLEKKFGGVTAVADVSLTLRSGEILAVIGPNGAGKSTLVNLLSGNLQPTSGTVHIGTDDVTKLRANEIAKHGLARTFQTPALFEEMNVASTVMVGAHLLGSVGMLRSTVPTPGALKEDRELAVWADHELRRLGLNHLANRDAKALSLGQQKMVEIARALVAKPSVLLLDEPCAGLNKAEKAALMQLIRELGREHLAVLVIEHDMEFVMSVADRVQVLNFGATLRVGSPEEVQNDQAVMDAYLGVSHEASGTGGTVTREGAERE